jgi:hypothetical protein
VIKIVLKKHVVSYDTIRNNKTLDDFSVKEEKKIQKKEKS